MNELGKPREVREGVFQIKLPTPYPIGPVYVYLIKRDPITPFAPMREIYPERRKGEAFVLLSEITGRLDLLEREDLVDIWEEKELLCYKVKGD